MMGKVYRNQFMQGSLTKEEDYKIAFVTLGEGQTFEWPDLKIDVSSNCYSADLSVFL